MLVVATILAVAGARRLPSSRPLALVGGLVAVLMAWLVAQRDDAGTAIILAVLFAIGATLAVWEPSPPLSRATRNTAIGVVVGLFVLRLFVSENGLLAVSASAVLVAALLTASEWFPLREPYRAHGFAFGTILVVVSLVFAGYLGAETPDATWFGGGTVHGRTDTGEVALTFDDGPNLGASEKVMAILDAHGVKGTFFEVGKAVDADPQITARCTTTATSSATTRTTTTSGVGSIPATPSCNGRRTRSAVRSARARCSTDRRTATARRSSRRSCATTTCTWCCGARRRATGRPTTRNSSPAHPRQRAPGAILLLHDGLDGNPSADRQVLVRALPLIIDGLRAKGLKPVRLDELLGTAAYQSC